MVRFRKKRFNLEESEKFDYRVLEDIIAGIKPLKSVL